MKQFGYVLCVVVLAGLAGCGKTEEPQQSTDAPVKLSEADYTTMGNGVKYHDFKTGTGATAEKGKNVTVHYTGWLQTGKKFDSSVDKQRPFEFQLGVGDVIAGWDAGVAGMRVGGKRQLVIPPDLAYGPGGYPPIIPENATLVFEVELLEVK